MTENSCDLVASWALDIHEVRVRVLHKSLQLVLPLLVLGQRLQQLLGKLERRRRVNSVVPTKANISKDVNIW